MKRTNRPKSLLLSRETVVALGVESLDRVRGARSNSTLSFVTEVSVCPTKLDRCDITPIIICDLNGK